MTATTTTKDEQQMPRLPALNADDLAPDDRELLARPIDIHRVVANLPEVLRGVVGIGDWIRWRSQMDARLRELAIIYVGVCAHSVYEYAHHIQIGLDFGVTGEDLDDLRAYAHGRANGFAATELAVLQATAELADRATLSDASWDRLVECVGSEGAAQLVATVSYYAMVVRLLASFAVELEPDYEPLLAQYPPPAREAPAM